MWIISSWHGDLKGLSEDWESQKLGRGLWGTLRALGSSWFPKDTLSVLQKQQKQPGLDFLHPLSPCCGQTVTSAFVLVCPQLLESPDPRITDPRRTWISFVHRPDDGNTSKRRCKGKDKKLVGSALHGFPSCCSSSGLQIFPAQRVLSFHFLCLISQFLEKFEPLCFGTEDMGILNQLLLDWAFFGLIFCTVEIKSTFFFPLPRDKVQVSQRINESRCGQVVYFKLMSWVTFDYVALFICCLDNLGCF